MGEPIDQAALRERIAETEEERADREETERDHARGDHTHCGITCEAEMPTEHLRNFVIAKGYPGTKGALDELLRRSRADALRADRDRLAAEVAELRQIVAAPVSAAGGPEFGQALVGKVRELVDERRHYEIAAEAVGRVRVALAEGQANGWTGFRYHQAISDALDGTEETP